MRRNRYGSRSLQELYSYDPDMWEYARRSDTIGKLNNKYSTRFDSNAYYPYADDDTDMAYYPYTDDSYDGSYTPYISDEDECIDGECDDGYPVDDLEESLGRRRRTIVESGRHEATPYGGDEAAMQVENFQDALYDYIAVLQRELDIWHMSGGYDGDTKEVLKTLQRGGKIYDAWDNVTRQSYGFYRNPETEDLFRKISDYDRNMQLIIQNIKTGKKYQDAYTAIRALLVNKYLNALRSADIPEVMRDEYNNRMSNLYIDDDSDYQPRHLATEGYSRRLQEGRRRTTSSYYQDLPAGNLIPGVDISDDSNSYGGVLGLYLNDIKEMHDVQLIVNFVKEIWTEHNIRDTWAARRFMWGLSQKTTAEDAWFMCYDSWLKSKGMPGEITKRSYHY